MPVDSLTNAFRQTIQQLVTYSSPHIGLAPILTLSDAAVNWQAGDQILVASTSWDPRESEVFTIVPCEGKFKIITVYD